MLPRWRLNFRHPGVARVLKLMAPAVFGVSVSQMSLLINTIFASFLVTGSVSWLYYADRLMEFPAGVLGVALGTILLPSLSKHHASGSPEEYSRLLDWGLRVTLLLALPAAAALAVLALPLIATLFHYGRFSDTDAWMTREALVAYSLGLVGLILVKILAPGFYARQNVATPVKIGLITLLATQAMNFAFIGPLKHAGLALAIGLGACLNALLLYRFLQKAEHLCAAAGLAGVRAEGGRFRARHGGRALARDGSPGAVAAGGLAVEGGHARRPGGARRRGLRRLPAGAGLPPARLRHARRRMSAREPEPLERFSTLVSRADGEIDLARACLQIAEDVYPGLDVDGYLGEIERFAKRLRARLAPDAAVEDRVIALNEFLFGDLGFCGNADDYYDPRNSYLNEVLDRRAGIPLTLSVLYMEIRLAHRAAARGRVLSGAFPGAPADARRHPGARPVRGRRAAVRGRVARAPEARDSARAAIGRRAGRGPAARTVPRAGEQAADPRAPAAQPEGHLPREGQAPSACCRCSTA